MTEEVNDKRMNMVDIVVIVILCAIFFPGMILKGFWGTVLMTVALYFYGIIGLVRRRSFMVGVRLKGIGAIIFSLIFVFVALWSTYLMILK